MIFKPWGGEISKRGNKGGGGVSDLIMHPPFLCFQLQRTDESLNFTRWKQKTKNLGSGVPQKNKVINPTLVGTSLRLISAQTHPNTRLLGSLEDHVVLKWCNGLILNSVSYISQADSHNQGGC